MVTKHVPHNFSKNTTTRTEIPDFMSPSVIRVGSEATIQETTQFMNKKNIGSVLNFKERTMSILVSSRKRIYRERSWAEG
jgi:predicted transcriptional regulator